MLEQQQCAAFLIEAGKHLWLYLISDEGHIVFAIIATARAAVYYLKRIDTPEASVLASTIIVALLFSCFRATDRIAPRIYATPGACKEKMRKNIQSVRI